MNIIIAILIIDFHTSVNILTLQICLNFSLLNSVFFYLHLTELQNNNIQHLIQDNEHNSLSLKELSEQFSFILSL